VVAHEVKNPLAGIRGALQVLGSRMPPESGDAAVASQVVARLDALNELVDDLLVFARPPQPRLAPVDLSSVVSSTRELLSRDPMMVNVQLTVTGSAPKILADSALLNMVVGNLLVNSAQAMNGHGQIQMTLTDAGGATELVVRDTGPGIPLTVRDKVFMPFFTTKARGTGLGLPTAKQLVEAQGGTISLECPDEGGTVVTLRFPPGPRTVET
jgi:two-component system sensor histidine kinase HydH